MNELDADERYFCQMDANSHKSQREVQPFTDSFHRKTHGKVLKSKDLKSKPNRYQIMQRRRIKENAQTKGPETVIFTFYKIKN